MGRIYLYTALLIRYGNQLKPLYWELFKVEHLAKPSKRQSLVEAETRVQFSHPDLLTRPPGERTLRGARRAVASKSDVRELK
jgi:hypothetical protein